MSRKFTVLVALGILGRTIGPLAANVSHAQGVHVRAPFVSVDVDSYGGVSVRAPFTAVDIPGRDTTGFNLTGCCRIVVVPHSSATGRHGRRNLAASSAVNGRSAARSPGSLRYGRHVAAILSTAGRSRRRIPGGNK